MQLGTDFLRAGKLSVFQCDNGARGVRNGVILETALCRDKAHLQLVDQRLQHAPERDGCICTTLVDLRAGVTALETGNPDFGGIERTFVCRHGNPDCRVCAARAADGQDAFFLGVDVEKPLALQNGGVEADRAVHAGFLVDGKQAFKPRVREVLRVQNRQCHRNGNAVVAAERRALRADKVTVHLQLQPVGQEVDGAVGRLFCDHVKMSLHDHRGSGFIAGRCGLDDDDVVKPILMDLQTAAFCKLHAVVADCLCVARAVGDGAQIFKKGQDILRFQLL